MIEIKNTRDLVSGGNMKLKMLVIGKSRVGKTTFASTAPNPLIAAVETGHGSGLVSLAGNGAMCNYFEPQSLEELDALASGHIGKDADTIVLDSLSATARTLVKDFAINMPRRGMESPKRKQGVPELDDYGVMAEIVRRILDALINLPKHIVVTALEKTEKDADGAPVACGPDLPGQMFLAAPAMFDLVVYLKTRKRLKVPNDPRSAYTEHYFVTRQDGFHVGGDRNNLGGKPILDAEEIFDPATNRGTFPSMLEKISRAYASLKPQTAVLSV